MNRRTWEWQDGDEFLVFLPTMVRAARRALLNRGDYKRIKREAEIALTWARVEAELAQTLKGKSASDA